MAIKVIANGLTVNIPDNFDPCPGCQVDRSVLKEMLAGDMNGDDYKTARCIIANCPECQKWYNELLRKEAAAIKADDLLADYNREAVR